MCNHFRQKARLDLAVFLVAELAALAASADFRGRPAFLGLADLADQAFQVLADFLACLVFQVGLDFLVAGSVGFQVIPASPAGLDFLALAVVVLAGSLAAALAVFPDLVASADFRGRVFPALADQAFPDSLVRQASLASVAFQDFLGDQVFQAVVSAAFRVILGFPVFLDNLVFQGQVFLVFPAAG